MADYRLYCLDGAGKITTAEWLDAKSDDEAIIAARSKNFGPHCEVWQGNRFVSKTEVRSG